MISHKLWLYLGSFLLLLGITVGIYGTGYSHAKGKVKAAYEEEEKDRVKEILELQNSLAEIKHQLENKTLLKLQELDLIHSKELSELNNKLKESNDACTHSNMPNDILNSLQ